MVRGKSDVSLASLDLNLLKVFLALLAEGSATAAGERLAMPQSSVSHCLTRLRRLFNDPLFVRSRRGLQPTSVALGLRDPIAQALNLIRAALNEQLAFDPATSDRTFNVLMTDAGEMFYAPQLVARLRKIAPGIRIVIHELPRQLYQAALEEGRVDIAVGQLPRGHVNLVQQYLSTETFEGFARKGHPIHANPTMAAYLAGEHLIVGKPAVAEIYVERALKRIGAKRKVVLELPHYLPAPFILEQTDLIAVLPSTFSKFVSRNANLQRFPPPFPIGRVRLHQFWHARLTNDAGCGWLRREVAALFSRSARQTRNSRTA